MLEEELIKRENEPLEEFNINLNSISTQIKQDNKTMFEMFNFIINKQMDIIYLNNILSKTRTNIFTLEITGLIYKNLISILSAILLIKNGYYGSARMIFRNVYENLLIGKMFAVTKDYSLYEKWELGNQLSIKKDIFMKINNETSKESRQFWDNLNKYNHGIIYSQDFILEYDKLSIDDCNTYISVLLEMNYHLLNKYVCEYRNYYLELYFGNRYKKLKKSLREIFNISRKMIDIRCKKVLKDYKSTWEII